MCRRTAGNRRYAPATPTPRSTTETEERLFTDTRMYEAHPGHVHFAREAWPRAVLRITISGFRGPIMRHSILAGVRALALSLVLGAGSAFAVPVTWTLDGATFADGGTASGWFVYDLDAPGGQILTDFSISVDGGDTVTFPPITYSPANAYGSVNEGGAGNIGTIFGLSAPGETRGVRIPAVTPLTDAGGTLAINLAGLGQGECYNCGPARSFVAGNLVGTLAPAITSAAAVGFPLGVPSTFLVTTTGAPTPAITVAGALPPGVAFVDNGDGTGSFSGVPTATGAYALTITASNGTTPDAVQAFTISVYAPAAALPAPTLGEYGLFACVLLLGAAAVRRLAANRA